MPAIHRILAAVKELDGKRLPAVLKAAQLARAYGAQLELFHALATPVYVNVAVTSAQGLISLEYELRQSAIRRLEAIADKLRRHGIVCPGCCG
jgi:nucleotide-binding universal stress UspA family protein